MNTKIFIKWVFVILVAMSCREKLQTCQVDPEFKKQFYNCINVMESTLYDSPYATAEVSTEEVLRAANCLNALTRVESQMKFREVGFAVYESKEDFTKDKMKWIEWYEKKKCNYSMRIADSLFKSGQEKLPEYHSQIVLDSLNRVWSNYSGDSVKIADSLFHVSRGLFWPRFLKAPFESLKRESK